MNQMQAEASNDGINQDASPPLRGMRVIDFTHFLAGPYATQMLGDMGAEVIKIENPGRGDEFRHYPPYTEKLDGEGWPFLWGNRNKMSMAVDMKSEQGLKLVRQLIATADIVVENFSSGVMERLGLSYEELSSTNKGLIYCSVSAYGRNGPFSDRLGFDPVAQAESGFMSLNGYPDRDGVRTGPSVMDIGTALIATSGILAAVVERMRSGTGHRVETSLYAGAMTMVGYAPMQVMSDKPWEAGRHGNSSPDTSPTGVFYASDGGIYIPVTSNDIFQRLFRMIGRDDLANDPVLLNKQERLVQRDRLVKAVNDVFATQPREHWVAKLRTARVPAGAVRSVAEAIASKESAALDIVSHIQHPTAGSIPNIRNAITLQKTPMVPPVAAPTLGQHTRHVLESVLHLSEEEIVHLNESGIFGCRLAPAVHDKGPMGRAQREQA